MAGKLAKVRVSFSKTGNICRPSELLRQSLSAWTTAHVNRAGASLSVCTQTNCHAVLVALQRGGAIESLRELSRNHEIEESTGSPLWKRECGREEPYICNSVPETASALRLPVIHFALSRVEKH